MADRFDVTRSSAHRVYRRVSKANAVHLAQRFIDFPSGQRAREENDKFEEMGGFPGVERSMTAIYLSKILSST